MRCIAIDDEPIALSIITNFCERYGDIELTTFTNPEEGMGAIISETPDLVFLDIEMNDYSGLELARQLPEYSLFIFTTAHANYALDGYEVRAVDFLHKPFSYQRFKTALSRIEQILTVRAKAKSIDDIPDSIINLKVEYQNVSIKPKDIIYVEGMDNYIKIFTHSNKPILTKMSIKAFMELLPEKDFIRIHRSFVVAKNRIIAYTKQQVKLNGANLISLPVGRIYGEDLFLRMLKKG